MGITIKSGSSGDYADVTPDGELKTVGTVTIAGGTVTLDGVPEVQLNANSEVTVTGNVGLTNPNSPGMFATLSPFGGLNVSVESVPIFYDVFDQAGIDTVNRWTVTGTVAPTVPANNLAVNPGTTGNASTVLNSIPEYTPIIPMTIASLIAVEQVPVTGNHRFFGFGDPPSTPGTAAAPLQDAIGFEFDTTGALRASVYVAGVRQFSQVLTRPSDGNKHRYAIVTRADISFFYVDDFDAPLAMTYIGPNNQSMPVRVASINSASVSATPTMVLSGAVVYDGARTALGISDGVHPWRKARVDPAGALSVASRPADMCVSATAGVAFGVTATLPAPGAGLFHYITQIDITKYASAALTPSATPSVVSTTNLPGPLGYTFATAQASGTTIDRTQSFAAAPLRSVAANTATTIVAQATTTVIWRLTVHYYTGS
jgi:hypothetical protein